MSRVRGTSTEHLARLFGFEGRLVRLILEDGPVYVTVQLDDA